MAQFFLTPPPDDTRYQPALQRFLDNVLTGNGVTPEDHHLVPYRQGQLSAYRFTPEQPRGAIVVFGGYDSYIEEWLPAARAFRDAGLDTVIFDGPGQGTVLDAGTPMTPDWHLPVAAVLDHFALAGITLAQSAKLAMRGPAARSSSSICCSPTQFQNRFIWKLSPAFGWSW